ncbi:hypothetical protein BDN72DRAFT_864189 [Pluteus cervinus]|uniref:Uncharacterized protein n=1 Tax=Pluteus cervinus TaxID=181527 RepID=A0ACD3A5R1_9AGAR|nr:hypothetical protein BDN72DRAFT_864189 [Pluteus cervinus]
MPALLVIVGGVLGYISEGSRNHSHHQFIPEFIWCVFLTNFCVTLLTAGRIGWVAHKTRQLLGKSAAKKYGTAVAIVIESGLIYSLSVLVVLVFPTSPYVRFYKDGIQVGLGRAFEVTVGSTVEFQTGRPDSVILDSITETTCQEDAVVFPSLVGQIEKTEQDRPEYGRAEV